MTNACCLNHFISCKSILISLVQWELHNKMPVGQLKHDIYLFLCLESTRLWQDETDQEAQSERSLWQRTYYKIRITGGVGRGSWGSIGSKRWLATGTGRTSVSLLSVDCAVCTVQVWESVRRRLFLGNQWHKELGAPKFTTKFFQSGKLVKYFQESSRLQKIAGWDFEPWLN